MIHHLRPSLLAFALIPVLTFAEAPETGKAAPNTPVWTDPRPGLTPKGNLQLHGPYLAEPVTAKLSGLPAHKWIRLRFKLIVLGSWDGSSTVWGPDLWSLQVRGAQRLYCATFSNMGSYNGNDPQSFPDDYPWLKNRAWTGADSHDTLGYPRTTGFSTEPDLTDAVYPVETLFPHEAADLTLDFMGNYGDPKRSQQSWAIADFSYELLGDLPPIPPETLTRLWEELGSDDAVLANKAFQALVTGGDGTITHISSRVAEITATEAPPEAADSRRLYRAHKLARILAGEHTSDLCFRIEQIIPEHWAKRTCGSCDDN